MVIFYAVLSVLAISAFIMSIGVFRQRPTWGQARRMGAPFAVFVWIQVVFYLAVIEGSIGIVDLFIRVPIWIDVAFFIIPPFLVSVIFFILSKRSTFKPHLFVALILVQLGIPGAHTVAKAAEQGTVEISQRGIVKILRYGNDFDDLNYRNVDNLTQLVPIVRSLPQSTATIAGTLHFKNTFDIGKLGDFLTARRLTSMGYSKLPSKYNTIHGIDGVYLKETLDGEVKELLIVENKVNKGRLAPGQMTDDWVIQRAEKMLLADDLRVRETGRLLLTTLAASPDIIKKELWHHNLDTGKTIVLNVTPIGKRGEIIREWTDSFIQNTIVSMCRNGTLQCDLR